MLWTTCASKLCLIKNLNTNSEPSTKNWSRDTRPSNYTSNCKESRTETDKHSKRPLKWTLIANHSRSKHKIKACWNQKIHLWDRITTHHRFHNPYKIRHLLWKDLKVSLNELITWEVTVAKRSETVGGGWKIQGNPIWWGIRLNR